LNKYAWLANFQALSSRNYLFLWIGMVLMMTSFQMQMIAQGYLVYDLTSEAKKLSFVSAASGLPMLLFSLIGGAIADKVDKRKLMQTIQVLATILTLFLAFTLLIGNGIIPWQYLLWVGLIQGVLWSFNGPARQALIPYTLDRKYLSNAVALMSLGMTAPTLIGPAIAGIMYSYIGPQGVYFFVSILTITAVIFTSLIKVDQPKTERSNIHVFSDIKDGLIYLWNTKLIRNLMLVGLTFLILSGPLHTLLPVIVINVFKKESETLGLFVSMMGIGSLFGTFVIAFLKQGKRGLFFLISALIGGLGVLSLAILGNSIFAYGIIMLIGLGNSCVWSLLQVLSMTNADDKYRGRIMSIFMMTFGLTPLVIIPIGYLVDIYQVQTVLSIVGLTSIIIAVFAISTQKLIRQIP
tara:strand:- start:8426 stop:9649 length:1224 start_codon:yes stop_codon:yes gene_type:complete